MDRHRVGRASPTLFAVIQSAWYLLPFTVVVFVGLAILKARTRRRWLVPTLILSLFASTLYFDFRAEGYTGLSLAHYAAGLLLPPFRGESLPLRPRGSRA